MTLRINALAPDFDALTTEGWINFYDWMGDRWAVLFSHPRDFTPVCTTELSSLAALQPAFVARGAQLIGLSVDPLDSHEKWLKDIESSDGRVVEYPIIADPEMRVALLYDMVSEEVAQAICAPAAAEGGREALERALVTVRSLFVIGPDKRVRASLNYPISSGRNFTEVLRLLDSCQLTEKYQVATPADWRHGQDVVVLPEVDDLAARRAFPDGWRSPLPYIRLVPDPSFGVGCFETLERH